MAAPNRFCALLQCRYPLIQAPMLGSTDERLAVAVATAGAVGSIPCSGLVLSALDEMLSRHRREHPLLALNYNFFCHEMPASPPAVSDAWMAALAPYYAREGVRVTARDMAASLAGEATPTFSEEHVRVLLRHRPRAVSFHFGLPPAALWEQVRESGIVTLASATTAEEAGVLAAAGVDVVVAQGCEAGGHRGIFLARPPLRGLADQPCRDDLLAAIRRGGGGGGGQALVVAAGGIADARGVRRLLDTTTAAGGVAAAADAVQVGTAFLLCDEATTHRDHRAALLRAKAAPEEETCVTNVLSGRPARGLCNAVMRDLGAVRADAPPYPYGQNYMAPLKQRNFALYGSLWCGQNRAGLAAIPAAAQVQRLMAEL